jgi:hypothetical protein
VRLHNAPFPPVAILSPTVWSPPSVYATIEYTLQLGCFLCRCTSLSHSYSKTCRRHPFLREIQIQVCSVTLRQQYRRRLHLLHVSLNVIYHINNLDDAIAFRFPPTVLADPVVCLKRALSLKNSCTVDILIMHSVGTVKTLCIMTYMQHEMCHVMVTCVTSAKMCDSKLSTISASMHIIPRKLI